MPISTKVTVIVLAILGIATALVLIKVLSSPKREEPVIEEKQEAVTPVDDSVAVDVAKSRSRDNTVVIAVTGLGGKFVSIAYELTYESVGLIKGVNSGSKLIEIGGKDTFEREVYLGTCSRNVCKPDPGVKTVSVVLQFTDLAGKKSQFTRDYDL